MDESPVTIVVAEDEAVIRMDLVEQLRELGYEVVGSCGDGHTAVRLCRELRPQLALLDISMPELDGLAAAAAIGELGTTAVVMLTAYGQRDMVDQAVGAGAMGYVVKPWSPTDLVPALELARTRYAEMAALNAHVGQLESSLRARKTIDRAKAKLMAAYGFSEGEAFRWLQKAAMDGRTAMVTVAEEILGAAENRD